MLVVSSLGQEGKMFRSILCAAVAAAAISLAVPAQAAMSDPGLNAAAPATLQLAYYHHHHYYYPHHHWWHSYAYVPYRHCWSERVWAWGGWRWVRRCD
jgi:hypothetical protein